MTEQVLTRAGWRVEVVASLSQCRTAAAQCGLFTYKSVPVIFEPPCTLRFKKLPFHLWKWKPLTHVSMVILETDSLGWHGLYKVGTVPHCRTLCGLKCFYHNPNWCLLFLLGWTSYGCDRRVFFKISFDVINRIWNGNTRNAVTV